MHQVIVRLRRFYCAVYNVITQGVTLAEMGCASCLACCLCMRALLSTVLSGELAAMTSSLDACPPIYSL